MADSIGSVVQGAHHGFYVYWSQHLGIDKEAFYLSARKNASSVELTDICLDTNTVVGYEEIGSHTGPSLNTVVKSTLLGGTGLGLLASSVSNNVKAKADKNERLHPAKVTDNARVILALTALGIDPTADNRFVKNGLTVLDALASFYVTGGGFRHTAGGDLNGMATEQGYYALAAYYRFANAQTRLYDMTDVAIQTGGSNTPATGDTGVLVWVIALPVTILAAAFVLKRKEREA